MHHTHQHALACRTCAAAEIMHHRFRVMPMRLKSCMSCRVLLVDLLCVVTAVPLLVMSTPAATSPSSANSTTATATPRIRPPKPVYADHATFPRLQGHTDVRADTKHDYARCSITSHHITSVSNGVVRSDWCQLCCWCPSR